MRRAGGLGSSLGVVVLLAGWAAGAQEAAPAAQVPGSVTIERVGGDTYFQLQVRWPADEVDPDYRTFQRASGMLAEAQDLGDWPADAVALVPRPADGALLYRLWLDDQGEEVLPWRAVGRPPAELTFIGRCRGQPARLELALRHPRPGPATALVPLTVELARAAKAKGLAARFNRAGAEFFAGLRPSAGRSFFAYAHQVLLRRLAREERSRVTPRPPRGAARDDLYAMATGALALQETLQLDRMVEGGPRLGKRTIPVASIPGVTVKPHPWDKMLEGRKPVKEPEAAWVPDDQYYVRFKTTRALRTFLEFADRWGGSVLGTVETGGRDFGTRERVERQLCLRASWLSDLLGPAVIESLVLTGTDPYLREGSDLTLIFHLKAPAAFEAAVGRYLEEARARRPDLKEGSEKHAGVTIQRALTADGEVRCYRASLGDNLRLYSNSPAGIRAVIDCQRGKCQPLSASGDFAYLRTIYPAGAAEEDGFVFLSDAWLRRLAGPQLRIGEARRLEALTNLEMVRNAALFYLWEHPGAAVPSWKELVADGSLDPKQLLLEPGDLLDWDPKTFSASSKLYGRMGALRPLRELAISKVSIEERGDYERFRDRYQDYWRTFFDPVGIRIRARDDIGLEVTILPLIDNSEYNRLKADLGGRAVALEPMLRTGPVVLHYAGHLNPESHDYKQAQNAALSAMPGTDRLAVEWLGERFEVWLEDTGLTLEALKTENARPLVGLPVAGGVEIKNRIGLAAFLVAFQNMVRTGAPGLVEFAPDEPYRGVSFTAIRPTRGGQTGEEWQDLAIHYGAVGDMLLASLSLPVLQRAVDAAQTADKAGARAVVERFGAAEKGHMALRLDLDQADQARPLVEFLLLQKALEAERDHLREIWLLGRTVGLGPAARATPEQALGYRIASALGGQLRYDSASDDVLGSPAGTLFAATVLERLPAGSPLLALLQEVKSVRATLEFTAEGLHTELTFRRRGK